MRIDKYLKITRLVKRRSVGKELCDSKKIVVNDKFVKGSYEVKIGDVIQIIFGSRKTIVKVADIKEVVKKDDVGFLYDLIGVERIGDD
ncbi:MAG: S4 domain-containing protein [Firmicutes bacterium]|nr:S4 domain-containing protein [Bacillota bacterium]